jgi:4'-phosphopantetheinyl transferase
MSATDSKPTASLCTMRVWHCPAEVDAAGPLEAECERMLVPEERRQADRFRRPTTRNQHVIGRAMARRLLGESLDAARQIRFATGDYGKPYVVTPPHAMRPFNVAHTEGLVLCGIADSTAELVGVDVESLRRRTSGELAERYFSRPEVDYLRRQREASRQAVFLRIWTLKEAFIKAIGTGLQTPLADFAFHDIESDRPRIEFLRPELDDGRRWQFVCRQARPGYIASTAVASKRTDLDLAVTWHPFESMLHRRGSGSVGNDR